MLNKKLGINLDIDSICRGIVFMGWVMLIGKIIINEGII
jgi:hypothetical protein